MSYSEKLLDPRWQKKRLEVLSKSDWACDCCGDKETTLNVHHKQYFKGRSPWEYDNQQLTSLCKTCHEEHHNSDDPLLEIVSRLPIDGPGCRNEAAFLLAGWSGQEVEFPAEGKHLRNIFQAGKDLRNKGDQNGTY